MSLSLQLAATVWRRTEYPVFAFFPYVIGDKKFLLANQPDERSLARSLFTRLPCQKAARAVPPNGAGHCAHNVESHPFTAVDIPRQVYCI